MDNEYYMNLALEQAKLAYAEGEVPVGCVIVGAGGELIGTGRNRVAREGNALRHAEIIAIDEACAKVGDWRLSEAVLFVTVEPCPMCAGAIIMSRINSVVYGAENRKAGCAGSIFNILDEPRFNHRVNIVRGVRAEECGALMTAFFRKYLSKGANGR